VNGAQARPETATFADEAFSCKNVTSAAGPRPQARPRFTRELHTVPDRFSPVSARAALFSVCFAASGALVGVPAAHATAATPDAPPVEIGRSQSGNYLAALVAGADRDTAAAAVYSREALHGDPRNVDLAERAFAAALAAGDAADSFSLAERLIARDPMNSLARLAIGARAIADGQFVAARAQLAAGEAGKAHDLTTTLLAAWSYAGAGDQRRALDTLDHIREPSLAVFRDFHAGLIADMLGNGFEAQRRLKAAYEANKNTLRLADVYARFLIRHGQIDAAKTVFADFGKLVPNHPLIVGELADIAAGKTPAPVIRNARDGAAEALYGLGGAGTTQGDELAALIYLRLALFLKPDHDLAAITVANLFEDLKRRDEAIRAYELVPVSSPMRESAEIQAALELDALGSNADATAKMRDIVAAHPNDPDAWSALGSLQRSAKAYADAADSYDKAITLVGAPTRSHWTLFYFRAICFERSKQWPKAEADFKKALELYPDQPQVLNYLGYSWVDQGINLDEAFKMLRRAVDLRPNDGYIVDSLGWAHYKLGHYQEATDALEKAIDLKPADPVVNDHLGDAYWRVDRRIEAHFQWNHARDMKPDTEDLPKILDKIEHGLPDQPSAATPAPSDAPSSSQNGGG
jgi:tetratricopeptide (TPR) repeat protein